MGFFITLLIYAAVFLASEILRPKMSLESARPSGLGDFRLPTATEGRPVPIIWGTVKLEAPNVVWYGNLRIRRLTEKVKTGMFTSDTVTTGYNYFVGIQFALCRGPIFGVGTIWVDDKIAGSGRTGDGLMSVDVDLGGQRTGRGSLTGEGQLYIGSDTQIPDPFLEDHQILTPAYRGTAYWVFQDGLAGSSTNIPKFAFETKRFPDGLSLALVQPGDEVINTVDCNPMSVIYEILTDTDWGLKIPTASVDLISFRAAAARLATEGNGWSMILDSEQEARDVLREVERQIDGILFFQRSTGLWTIKLARDDYVAASLDLYSESSILTLSDYSRQSWEETTNQIRLLFVDNQDNYKETYALAQDMANVEIQGGNVSVDVRYPGVKNRTLANRIAWRELGTLSYPISRVAFICNRKGFSLLPGSVFRFSWAALGLSDVVFRVTRIDPGNIDSERITVSAIQDIFVEGVGTYSDPPSSDWADPDQLPVPVVDADTLLFEAPGQLVAADSYDPILQPRVWAGGRDPGGGTVAFQLHSRFSSSRPLTGPFNPEATVGVFLLAGELDSDLDPYGPTISRPSTQDIFVTNNTPDDLSSLEIDASDYVVRSFATLLFIGNEDDIANGEFVGYQKASAPAGGVVTISKIYRGLFHTPPKVHAAGTRVWFLGQTGGNLTNSILGSNDDEIDIQLRSQGISEVVSEASTPIEELTLAGVYQFPLAPRDPFLNGIFAPSSGSIDVLYASATGFTGDDALAIRIEITARNWRTVNVLQDDNLASTWLDDTPEFDFVLVLDSTPTTLDFLTQNISSLFPNAYVTRNNIIVALGANTPIPSAGQLQVTSRHSPPEHGTVTNTNKMLFDFTVTSALQSADEMIWGGIVVGLDGSTGVSILTAGNYTFSIHTPLPAGGEVSININSGGWSVLIGAGLSFNTQILSVSDSVQLRFDVAPVDDQFFDVFGAGDSGYGVLLS